MSKKNLLQVRHNQYGLLATCNEYLQAFDGQEFRKIVVILKGCMDTTAVSRIPADEVVFLDLTPWQLQFPPLLAAFRLSRLCRHYDVDLILAHRYKPAVITAIASFLYRSVPLTAVVHKTYQFNTVWRCFMGRLLFKPRFRFVGVSEATKEHILNKGVAVDSKDVLALPNCIDLEMIRAKLFSCEEARRQLGLSMDDFVIGTVGRLSPVKDQTTLLRAFAAFRIGLERARLVVVGDGRLEIELKTEAERLGLGDSVVFAGHVPDAYRIMSAFDVFVLTSVSEAFGRVVIEAMACCLPVVVTEAGGIPEVMGETVKLYKCGDYEGISVAFAMHYRMSAEERQEVGCRMALRVETHFSNKVFRQRLLEFIRESWNLSVTN